jgi:hypothetical protein
MGQAFTNASINQGARKSDLLKPFDARLMRMFPVSSRVNQVQNDDAECARPVELEAPSQVSMSGDGGWRNELTSGLVVARGLQRITELVAASTFRRMSCERLCP